MMKLHITFCSRFMTIPIQLSLLDDWERVIMTFCCLFDIATDLLICDMFHVNVYGIPTILR